MNDWIEKLKLQPHPEGGYYRETYRSTELISQDALPDRFSGQRCFSTAIYFLLPGEDFSAFHRIQQEEVWHYYAGGSITLHKITPAGEYSVAKLGLNIEQGERPQIIIKAGDYFAAEVSDKSTYALAGCTVAPGFDFADFDMPTRAALIQQYPQHQAVITRLTR